MLAIAATVETIRVGAVRALPQFLLLFPTCHLAYGVGLLSQCALWALPALGLKARSEAEPS